MRNRTAKLLKREGDVLAAGDERASAHWYKRTKQMWNTLPHTRRSEIAESLRIAQAARKEAVEKTEA